MIIMSSNLAAIAFGVELQKDQKIVLITLIANLIGPGACGLSSVSGLGATNEAKVPASFLGSSNSLLGILLKAEHQSHVETRLAWTAIKLAPKPLTIG